MAGTLAGNREAHRVGRDRARKFFAHALSEMAQRSCHSFRVTREVLGQHPYARVQILTPAQAEDQSWSHLILVGLNETAWPAANRGDFLPAAQIDAFNRSVQKINRAATRRGRQGEGHVTVREGKTLFLGAAQQRQLALAQFAGLLESAQSWSRADRQRSPGSDAGTHFESERIFQPRLITKSRGIPLSQATMRALRDDDPPLVTRFEIKQADARSWKTPGIAQTRVAYEARRKIESSGEYDFALREPPNETKPMSVSDAEAILKSPALIWMERYLGVEGAEDSTYAWNATVGKWTHDWLAAVFGRTEDFVPFPAPDEIVPRILARRGKKTRARSANFAGRPAQLCRIGGIPAGKTRSVLRKRSVASSA